MMTTRPFPDDPYFPCLAQEISATLFQHDTHGDAWNITPDDAQRLNKLSRRLYHREWIWLECLGVLGLDIVNVHTDANGCSWYYVRKN